VTDDAHELDDVPAGCKLVAETVKIVDDEDDDYEPNDIVLTRVVTDPALDVSVLKTRAALRTIPYRIGRSAGIHVGNTVAVHGFPLGAFAATNLGKVVNAYDHDTDKDWDHVDFVTDALLSPGNSGSPVFAVSCRTGEYELVGIYHAGYVRGSALNVVVGIDQVKDLMLTLRRAPRAVDRSLEAPGPDERKLVQAALAAPGAPAVFPFPFGPLVGMARRLPSGALAYEVFSRGFPLRDDRVLVVEDLMPAPSGAAFGATGRVYLGNARGLRELEPGALDADAQAQLDRVMARLRLAVVQASEWRRADETTSKGHRARRSIEAVQQRQSETDRDAVQSLSDLADRLGPRPGDTPVAYKDALPSPPQREEPLRASKSTSAR
jgi:serine protease Do